MRLLTADHPLRTLNVTDDGQTFPKRVYTMSFRLWDAAGDTPLRAYADAVQPLTAETRGGGILDLHHVYPVGWVPADGATPDAPKRVAVWAGSADAHSPRYQRDLVKLLGEMAPSSPRSQPLPGMRQAQVSDVVPFRPLPAPVG